MRASEVRATLDATGRGESELRSHDGFEGTIARPSHLSPGHTGERFPPGAREATRRRMQVQMIFFLLDGREGPARRLTDLCVRLAGLPFLRADKIKGAADVSISRLVL